MKKKVCEYIDGFIGNSIYDFIKFLILTLVPSGVVAASIKNCLSSFTNNTIAILCISCAVMLCGIILSVIIYKNVRKYKFEFIYQHVTFEYNIDKMIVTTEYKVRAKRNNLKSLYSRSSWFKDEKQKIECLNKDYEIREIDSHDTSTEFDVVFDKPMMKNEVRTFRVRVKVTNKHRHFENFYSREIIAPVQELAITLIIPSKYNIKEIWKHEIYGSIRDDRSTKTRENFDVMYTWEIPTPIMGCEYKINW